MSDKNESIVGKHIAGPFIVYCRDNGKTLFAGCLDEPPLQSPAEELWVCEMEIVAVKRFKIPERLRNMRIDQILTDVVSPDELEPIG